MRLGLNKSSLLSFQPTHNHINSIYRHLSLLLPQHLVWCEAHLLLAPPPPAHTHTFTNNHWSPAFAKHKNNEQHYIDVGGPQCLSQPHWFISEHVSRLQTIHRNLLRRLRWPESLDVTISPLLRSHSQVIDAQMHQADLHPGEKVCRQVVLASHMGERDGLKWVF